MILKAFHVRNFRRLKDTHVACDRDTTIFVGANSSGKTAATHAFQYFCGPLREFSIYDLNSSCWEELDAIGTAGEVTAGQTFPAIQLDLWFEVQPADIHRVLELLPSLDWASTPVGVRIEYAAKDVDGLLGRYKLAREKAEQARKQFKDKGDYHPWPTSLTDYLKKKLTDEFDRHYFVLDYTKFGDDYSTEAGYVPSRLGSPDGLSGKQVLRQLLRVDFLHAQRYLADEEAGSRATDLSKRFSSYYRHNLPKREDDLDAMRALAESEQKLDEHFSTVFTSVINKLAKLGYPGFTAPDLVIRSDMGTGEVLAQTAKVHYRLSPNQETVLPDRYNGLGFKNLIYMVIEILDYDARWREEDEDRPPLHVIFVEEPEAHLHAQLQQVFIQQIREVLEKDGDFPTQLVITTHSPHIIYSSGFGPIRYFRRSAVNGHTSANVLNLSSFKPAATTFLQRYMKVTHCDLFFADAAVLVEGNVERLLLPTMIEKAAPELQSCYLSVLEVGGAFAHIFRELLEFLGLATLVITDLDSVKPQPKGADDPEEETPATACQVDPTAITSNATLKQWLPKRTQIGDLLAADEAAKTQAATPQSPSVIRVVYQIPQNITWMGATAKLTGRTLEEMFALENLEWCQHKDRAVLGLRVRGSDKKTLSEMGTAVFERVGSSGFEKTEFALALMQQEPDGWKVPRYIQDGLVWLKNELAQRRKRTGECSPDQEAK